MNNRLRTTQTGFTLVEMLVAIAIFAVLSMMAYGGLNTVLNTQQQLDAEMQRLREIQRTFMFLGGDLRQTAERHIRNPLSPPQDNALITTNIHASQDFKIELTRAGYPNPLLLQRSHLQRVAYLVKDDNLYRYTWPVLDRAQDTLPNISRLCTKITDMRFQFYPVPPPQVANNPNPPPPPDPSPEWPPFGTTPNPFLPAYVAVTLEFEDWGEVTRLYAINAL